MRKEMRANVRDGRNIQDAVTKSPEGDGRVADVGLVAEGNLQERDILHNRGRDGGDQEEDGSGEEEEGADVVNETGLGHLDGFDGFDFWGVLFG
jgi:hypothetical protein